MAIQLRANETVQSEVHFHWIAFLVPAVWAATGTVGIFSLIVMTKANNFPLGASFFLVFLYGPLFYSWLKNKNKIYVITNQRLYIENGILTKTKVDVPLNKINDIDFSQGVLQRVCGAGNISVWTGNDKSNEITDVTQPEHFREVLSAVCNSKAA